ncbi:hypothetical protein CSUI_007333, partial [Cystoisospora suis]
VFPPLSSSSSSSSSSSLHYPPLPSTSSLLSEREGSKTKRRSEEKEEIPPSSSSRSWGARDVSENGETKKKTLEEDGVAGEDEREEKIACPACTYLNQCVRTSCQLCGHSLRRKDATGGGKHNKGKRTLLHFG